MLLTIVVLIRIVPQVFKSIGPRKLLLRFQRGFSLRFVKTALLQRFWEAWLGLGWRRCSILFGILFGLRIFTSVPTILLWRGVVW